MSAELELPERVATLELQIKRIRPPRDGRDGRDGEPGPPGIGEAGPAGKDGRDGKDADPALIAELVTRAAEDAAARLPRAKDGADGKDADPELVRGMVAAALAEMPKPRDGRDADPELVKAEVAKAIGGIKVRAGARGLQGEPGPIGPMPRHEWEGTRLRFEIDVGVWGDWVDLRGPKGESGGGRLPKYAGASTFHAGGSGNAYFPAGW